MLNRNENFVQIIYHLAKSKNENALTEILNNGISVNILKNGHNAIMLLARDDDTDSVNFLIEQFGANYNHAVLGYGWGGHTDKINAMFKRFPAEEYYAVIGYAKGKHVDVVKLYISQSQSNQKFAVWGYAWGGHHAEIGPFLLLNNQELNNYTIMGYGCNGDKVSMLPLLTQGGFYKFAVRGAAFGGFEELVHDLLNTYFFIDDALRGFACGNQITNVNEFCKKTNMQYNNDIVDGYMDWGGYRHTHEENKLRLIIFTENQQIKRSLAERFSPYNSQLLTRALRIERVMREYELDYIQAKSLTTVGIKEKRWFLQGALCFKNNCILPMEIFFHISSFLFRLSIQDTKKVYHALCNKIFLDAGKNVLTAYEQAFFSRKTNADSENIDEISCLNYLA